MTAGAGWRGWRCSAIGETRPCGGPASGPASSLSALSALRSSAAPAFRSLAKVSPPAVPLCQKGQPTVFHFPQAEPFSFPAGAVRSRARPRRPPQSDPHDDGRRAGYAVRVGRWRYAPARAAPPLLFPAPYSAESFATHSQRDGNGQNRTSRFLLDLCPECGISVPNAPPSPCSSPSSRPVLELPAAHRPARLSR